MNPTRPTIRCLREDLGIAKLPPAHIALDEIDHPLIHKASAQFAGGSARERIASVDDNVLLKVKIQRWRGAVWQDNRCPWLVAAGRREDGSPDDFYAALAERARQARKAYNSSHTHRRSPVRWSGPISWTLKPPQRSWRKASKSRPRSTNRST
ncbi:hypothetical protein [Acrocarpospora catenulata]|uniref:hypothetical protein n=1 Tax=Acrocarpospora catenulata TaxID=2836182 RepID=UPI001BDA672D|nr:hypothetical protein [Acrocarpospora catenulata]